MPPDSNNPTPPSPLDDPHAGERLLHSIRREQMRTEKEAPLRDNGAHTFTECAGQTQRNAREINDALVGIESFVATIRRLL